MLLGAAKVKLNPRTRSVWNSGPAHSVNSSFLRESNTPAFSTVYVSVTCCLHVCVSWSQMSSLNGWMVLEHK